MRWALQPLLDLRRREEADATAALGRALARWRAAEAEAASLRRAAAEVAARALRPWDPRRQPGGAGGPGPGGGTSPVAGATLAAAATCTARLGVEAARVRERADRASARVLAEAEAVEASRAGLGAAVLRREVLERLATAWRRARAAEAARRAEGALDDRPWRCASPPSRAISASPPGSARRAPARTGP